MPAGVVDGHLDGAGVRSQLQCAGAPAVAQGVGDELGHDQDHGVCDFRGPRPAAAQTLEEGPCLIARVGNGCRGTDGCGVDGHHVHHGHPGLWIVHARPLPTRPLCPAPPPANPAEPQCLPEKLTAIVDAWRHAAVRSGHGARPRPARVGGPRRFEQAAHPRRRYRSGAHGQPGEGAESYRGPMKQILVEALRAAAGAPVCGLRHRHRRARLPRTAARSSGRDRQGRAFVLRLSSAGLSGVTAGNMGCPVVAGTRRR